MTDTTYQPDPAVANGDRIIQARPLTAVAMRSIEWLEKPLWQRSAFQLLAGPKGSGKGTYLAGLASRITNAGQNALFVSTEDSAEIDLKPRLVAAGADIARCFDIPMHINLPDDIYALQKLAVELGGVGLFVIDPVANHIGDRDSNGDTAIRDAIAPLNALANTLSCLLIGVRHPGKDRSRGALASVLGSTAWIDVPRAVVMIAKDDENDLIRHIQVIAGNRALNGKAQHFRIDAKKVEDLAEPITYATELGQSEKNVDDLLMITVKEPSKSDKARAAVLDILEERGEQESDALDAEVAQQVGLAAKTIRNVRSELRAEGLVGIRAAKDDAGTVEHWVVYRTLAPRQGKHYDPHPDTGNDSRDLDTDSPHPDFLNDQSGPGKPHPDPLLTSVGNISKQAKNGDSGEEVGIQVPTAREHTRATPARLSFSGDPADPGPDEPDFEELTW